MARVYEKQVDLRRQDDGSYTLSVRVNDNTVIVKSLEKREAEALYQALGRELKKDD
jgi:hypothetical protein